MPPNTKICFSFTIKNLLTFKYKYVCCNNFALCDTPNNQSNVQVANKQGATEFDSKVKESKLKFIYAQFLLQLTYV